MRGVEVTYTFDSKLDKNRMTWKEDRETSVQNRTAVHEKT